MTDQTILYQQLREHFDALPIGMPATDSGTEIEILKELFTPDEAEIVLQLSILPESVRRIHKRLKHLSISREDLDTKLHDMKTRGLIIGDQRRGGNRYSRVQLAIGMFEFQVDRLTKNFMEQLHRYEEEAFGEELHRTGVPQMRPVPINESIKSLNEIATYDMIREYVKKSPGPFAAVNCVCRQGMDVVGNPCRQTDLRETCLMIGSTVELYVHTLGSGREVNKEEFLEILTSCEKAGLVIQPGNSLNPSFICCCCGCCCGILTTLKKLPRPAEATTSNYFAEVDHQTCTSCAACIDTCPMEALSLEEEGTEVDRDRCIGCGVCTVECPTGALVLKKKVKEVKPPASQTRMYMKILVRRIGFWNLIKTGLSYVVGKKV